MGSHSVRSCARPPPRRAPAASAPLARRSGARSACTWSAPGEFWVRTFCGVWLDPGVWSLPLLPPSPQRHEVGARARVAERAATAAPRSTRRHPSGRGGPQCSRVRDVLQVPLIAPLAQPANPLEATTGEATTPEFGVGAPAGGAPAGTAMPMEDLAGAVARGAAGAAATGAARAGTAGAAACWCGCGDRRGCRARRSPGDANFAAAL